MPERLRVEVACVGPAGPWCRSLRVAAGCTLAQAVAVSGLTSVWPELDLSVQPVGVWGEPRTPDTVLRDGDRVEVYRPVPVDARERRRLVARARRRRVAGG